MRKLLLILLTSILCFPATSFAQYTSDCGYAGTALTVGASCTTVAFNSTNATDYWNSATGCSAADRDDAWWWFTATSTSTTITYNSASDAILHVLTGACSATMSYLACADNSSSGNETVILATTIGVNYAIRIQQYNSDANMNGTICVYNTPLGAGCTPNTTIASIPYVQTGFNTAGSGDDFSSSDACGSSYMNGDDYVFTYTPSVNECVNIALTNTSTYVGVFVTNGCPSMGASCVASNTNSSGNPSISGISLTSGVTYFITVSTYPSPQTTPFDISITACPPPPSNDLCSGATNLPCGTTALAGTTVSTTNTAHGTSCTMSNYGVWYTFVGDGNTTTITINNSYDIELSISSGSCGTFTNIVCTDFPENHTFATVNGVTYYVYVAYYASGSTTGTFDISRTCTPPPSNDDPCSATPATVNADLLCGLVTAGSTTAATNSGIAACAGTADDDVWFSFAATSTVHNFSLLNITGSVTNMVHEIFSGACGSLTSIACSDPNSSQYSGFTVGQTYFVRVYTNSALAQTVNFNLCIGTPPPPPSNDLCGGATNLACGTTNLAGTTVSTTNVAHGTGCLLSNYGVWYTFVGDGQNTTISATGVNLDIEMAVVSGNCGSLTNITCMDNSWSSTGTEIYSFVSTPGTTYYIYIAGQGSGSSTTGNFTISRTCAAVIPTCFDGIQNGTETGVDCGGSCLPCGSTCTYSICLEDSYGDGWNGNSVDVFVNGVLIYNDITLASGYGPECTNITVTTNDDIDVTYNATGTFTSENDFYLYGVTGNLEASGDDLSDILNETANCNIPVPPINGVCSGMEPICSDSPISFTATEGGAEAEVVEPGNDYDCLSTSPNPTWFYLEIATGGSMDIDMAAYEDIDFALWGPYANLTTAQAACGSLPVPIDCSYDPSETEQANSTAIAGEVYILLVTNYADVSQQITLNSAVSNTAVTDCAILPITLITFDAKQIQKGNLLTWVTATEINNDYFVVESSTDMINFYEVGRVDGAGNSNNVLNYQFVDYTFFEKVIYYRLKQVDFDGVYSYSKTVAVKMTEEGDVNIYPNPAKEALFLDINSEKEAVFMIRYVNILGDVVQEKILVNKGSNTYHSKEFKQLNTGIYFIQLINESNEVIKNQKLVKE